MQLRAPDLHRVLGLSALALFLGSAVLLCAFKILDRDFWWHITAGEMMWRSGHLIAIEPFAYTREGLPYLATHEWLAQLFLFFALLFLQVLWVNLHGGAAMVGLLVIGALLLQRFRDRWHDLRVRQEDARFEIGMLSVASVLMALALFASPNGLDTFDYLHHLLTDQTIAFINEWRPRPPGEYLWNLGRDAGSLLRLLE